MKRISSFLSKRRNARHPALVIALIAGLCVAGLAILKEADPEIPYRLRVKMEASAPGTVVLQCNAEKPAARTARVFNASRRNVSFPLPRGRSLTGWRLSFLPDSGKAEVTIYSIRTENRDGTVQRFKPEKLTLDPDARTDPGTGTLTFTATRGYEVVPVAFAGNLTPPRPGRVKFLGSLVLQSAGAALLAGVLALFLAPLLANKSGKLRVPAPVQRLTTGPIARALAWVIFAVALGAVLWQVRGSWQPPIPYEYGGTSLGTSHAPYSDALGPWLHGGISYLFFGEPPSYLYRPMIGMFLASILRLGFDVSLLPRLAIGLFIVATVAFFLIRHRLVPGTIVWIVSCFALFYPRLLGNANPGCIMIDTLALTLTLTGTLLVAAGLRDGAGSGAKADPWVVLTGFFILGVVSAMRGPQLAGSGCLGLLAAAFLLPKRRLLLLAGCFVVLMLPFVVDSTLRSTAQLENNAISALHGVYWDPTHTWTTESHEEYLRTKPSTLTIASKYLAFMCSGEGLAVMWRNIQLTLHFEAKMIASLPFRLLALTAWLLCLIKCPPRGAFPRKGNAWLSGALRALAGRNVLLLVHAVLFPALLAGAHSLREEILAVYLVAMLGVLGWSRRWFSLTILLMFSGTMLFFAALGNPGQGRVSSTFEFLLTAAWGAAIIESALAPWLAKSPGTVRKPIGLRVIGLGFTAIILLLYTGNYVLPSRARATYFREVHEQKAALKVSNDPRIDRSLYFTGDEKLRYGTFDPRPPGSVIRYERVEPGTAWNESFINPNRFIERPR